MKDFVKKHIMINSKEKNRLYLGYKKGWKREDYYIKINSDPAVMIMGSHDDIIHRIGTLIGYNVTNRLFDSEVVLEVYGENSNVKDKYADFVNVHDDKSIETLLVELRKDAMQRLEQLYEANARNIKEYNEQAKQTMKRRVVIIDGFEDVMDNIIVSSVIPSLLARSRTAGITIVATVNTERLNERKFVGLLAPRISYVMEHFTCKILTQINKNFRIRPFSKIPQLEDNQMVIVNDNYVAMTENNWLSDVIQIPKDRRLRSGK